MIELTMDRLLVIEIPIASVDRQPRRRNRHEERARAALYDLMAFARGDDDDLTAETRRSFKLRINVGPHAAAGRCIEGANIDDPHGAEKPGNPIKLK